MTFKPGENVGPYQVIAQLGQGGMASVYKAYHPALDRYVALKVMHQAFNQDSTFISRFQREARVVAKLEHPNIVPVYDFADHAGSPFLVMKFIEGDTLKARLNRGPLNAREIELVADTVGSALAYAHKQGVLHRDVKPSNVLISGDGIMYLADFGLARIVQAVESTLSADAIMGTPQYISPEQAMGKKDLDGRTDIYSLGVMLYEMVVGRVPFNADTPFSIIHDHIYTPLPLPQSVNSSVPEPVQRVLLKSLAKDRDDRFQTVEQLIAAFKSAWLEAGVPIRGTDMTVPPARPVNVSVPAPTPRVENVDGGKPLKGPEKKRGKAWVWVAVGLSVCLCLAVGAFALRLNSQRAPASVDVPAETSLPSATLPASNETTPEIQAGLQAVQANPSDPNAHLQLSLAYWQAGMEQPAADEYHQALKLAGENDAAFFVSAAEQFKLMEAWHLAAGFYARGMAAQLATNGVVDEAVKEGFREAAFKAAPRKDFPVVVQYEQMSRVQLDFFNIVRGRHALYNGDIAEAENAIAAADRIQNVLPEVNLLRAEIALQKGDGKLAQDYLNALTENANAPSWVRTLASEILQTIQ